MPSAGFRQSYRGRPKQVISICLLPALLLSACLAGCANTKPQANLTAERPPSPTEQVGVGAVRLTKLQHFLSLEDIARELHFSLADYELEKPRSMDRPGILRLRRSAKSDSIVREIILSRPVQSEQFVSIRLNASMCADLDQLSSDAGLTFERWYYRPIFDIPEHWANNYRVATSTMVSNLRADGKNCGNPFTVSKRLIPGAGSPASKVAAVLAQGLEKLAKQDHPISREDLVQALSIHLDEFSEESQRDRRSSYFRRPEGTGPVLNFTIRPLSRAQPSQWVQISVLPKDACITLEDIARPLERSVNQSSQPPFNVPEYWRYQVQWEDDTTDNRLYAGTRECAMTFDLKKTFKHLPDGYSFDP